MRRGRKSHLSSGSAGAIASVCGGARDGVARAVLGVTSPLLGLSLPQALGDVRSPRAGSELVCSFPLTVTLAPGWGVLNE